jgi:CubicO group peptidase (beta-lactamase class C family)
MTPHSYQARIKDDKQFQSLLDKTLKASGQPALACAIIGTDQAPLLAAGGRTISQTGQMVTTTSLFHIGSTIKFMTATLTAILVAEGRLGYNSTLQELADDIPMREVYKSVTVEDLIYSRAGIIPFQSADREAPELIEALWSQIPLQYANKPTAF